MSMKERMAAAQAEADRRNRSTAAEHHPGKIHQLEKEDKAHYRPGGGLFVLLPTRSGWLCSALCAVFRLSLVVFPALALRRVCGRYRGLWRGVPFSCYYKSD